jgi:hypothetical protein
VAQLELRDSAQPRRLVRLVRFVLEGLDLKNRSNHQLGNSKRAAFAKHNEDKRHHGLAVDEARRALELEGVRSVDMVPAKVWILRASFGRGFDDDGLAHASKRVRDGIAEALEVDDGGPFIRFRYGNLKASAGVHAVVVRIEHEVWRESRTMLCRPVFVTRATKLSCAELAGIPVEVLERLQPLSRSS